MASAVTLLKKFANVNHCVIDSFEFVTNAANVAGRTHELNKKYFVIHGSKC